MELDTGAAVSTININTFLKLFPKKEIMDTDLSLKTYTGEVIRPIGFAKVEVEVSQKSFSGNLYIFNQNLDTILEREWIQNMDLASLLSSVQNLNEVNVSGKESLTKKIVHEFKDVFEEKIGKIPNMSGELQLREDVTPMYIKPRPMPYAIKEKVEEELKRLDESQVIEKITHADWGTPIVPVLKKDGSIRVCADYKVTLNRFLFNDKYPIPRVDEIFTKMRGGQYFCMLDVHKAYLHIC